MKKRSLTILLGLALVMVLALTACGGAAPAAEEAGEEPAAEEEEAAEPAEAGEEMPRAATIHNAAVTASLYDQVHADGLEAMGEEYGFATSVADSVEYAQTADTARALAADGTDIVFLTSGGHASVLLEVPPEFPDTWFILVSAASELPGTDNAAIFNTNYYEAGFLVGVAAALQTETGKVGCVGGVAIPPIVANCSGMIDGAAYIDPDVEVEIGMIGDFVDVAKAKEIAAAMAARGVDVFFSPSGGAAQGVIQAAEEAGVAAIGYIADESFRAPDTIITSEIVDFGAAYMEAGRLYTTGELEPKIYDSSVATGDITLHTPFGGPVREGVEERAMEVVEEIRSGELVLTPVMYDDLIQ